MKEIRELRQELTLARKTINELKQIIKELKKDVNILIHLK